MTKRIWLASAALPSTLPAELTPDPHVGGRTPHQPPPHWLRSMPASRGQRVSSGGEQSWPQTLTWVGSPLTSRPNTGCVQCQPPEANACPQEESRADPRPSRGWAHPSPAALTLAPFNASLPRPARVLRSRASKGRAPVPHQLLPSVKAVKIIFFFCRK